MRIEVKTGYLGLSECEALNAWADMGVSNGTFTNGRNADGSTNPLRFTTRLSPASYPPSVYDLDTAVRAYCGVSSYAPCQQGTNGIVCNYIQPGGDVFAHTDQPENGLAILRCNIVTRAAQSGGELFVGGQALPLTAGELHCYLASEFEHYVTTVGGNLPRVMWSFSALVPAADWETGTIIFGA